jgi:hypothetical protein
MIKQNEIKVLLMANVHGGNLHHPDTEAIKDNILLCFYSWKYFTIHMSAFCIVVTVDIFMNVYLLLPHEGP